jgi:spermidine synthase
VLMDVMSLHALSVVLLTAALAWVWPMGVRYGRQLLGLVVLTWVPFTTVYERLQYKSDYNGTMRFPTLVESKHGVITVDSNHRVYGNGAYDGVIETALEPGSWLVRPYILSAVREPLDDVLIIGVASGAWTQIIAHHPHVQHMTAVELSEGYLDVIAHEPIVRSLLTHPKVDIVIDDGRRWLRRNPTRKFDAIVMNTTHHWREFASALLSVEFLTQVKAHLKPAGIAYWNCTDSQRAARTGMAVFPHTMMIMNHCLASNAPLSLDRPRWEAALSTYAIEGKPLFDLQSPSGRTALNGVLDFVDRHEPTDAPWRWMDRAQMQAWCGSAKLVTDDNLGDEY